MTNAIDLSGSLSGGLSAVGLPTSAAQALAAANLSPENLQNAITSLTGIDATAQTSILNAAEGVASGGASANSIANLVAAGFAATGVGAPVAAAITLGLPMVEGLAQLLGGSKTFAWKIGEFEVPAGTKRPYGPRGAKDPRWLTFDAFMSELLTKLTVWGAFTPFLFNLDAYVPGMTQISNESVQGAETPVDAFRLVYDKAWEMNAEFLLNGQQWVDPYTLLTTLAKAWNATHEDSSTMVMGPTGGTYINNLLNGDYDGQDHPPLTLNTGPEIVAPDAPPAPPPKVIDLKLQPQPTRIVDLESTPTEAPAPGSIALPTLSPAGTSKFVLGGLAAVVVASLLAAKFL